jgi:opacity protein-like surface antigen
MRIRHVVAAGTAALLASALAMGPAAQAADYPVLRGSQIEDVPPAPDFASGGYNWTGFYIGGFAGQSQTRFRTDRGVMDLANGAFNATTVLNEASPGELVRTSARDDTGTTFGGFLGYNMAFGDAVVGVEAEYSRMDHETSAVTLEARRLSSGDIYVASIQDAKLSDYINARLRFGYAYGRLMPYFTIGGAAGRFDTNVAVAADWVSAASNYTTSYLGYPRVLGGAKKDVWGYGFSVGGGLEAALLDNVIVRGEYLFTRFNNVEGVTVNVNTARVAAALKF